MGRNSIVLLLALTVCWINAVYAVRITITPKELVGKKTGDSFSISCRADDVGDMAIGGGTDSNTIQAKWSKLVDGQDTPITSSGGRVLARPGTNRTSVSLMFDKVELEDAGTYKCSFGDESASITIPLYRSISFKDTKSEQHPTAGQDGVIKCDADGEPKPEISWSRNNEAIDDNENGDYSLNGNDLLIKNYDTQKHEGTYKCEAIQSTTGDFKWLEINVIGYVAPGPVSIALSDAEKWTKGVHEDATMVRLTCTADGVPKPEMTWTMNGGQITDNNLYNLPEAGVLEIEKMTHETAGTYSCSATNVVGKNDGQLDVQLYLKPRVASFDPSGTVLFGENFATTCSGSGSETLKVEILKNGAPISEKSSDGDGFTESSGDGEPMQQSEQYVSIDKNTATLNIKSATLENAGEYECKVSNDAGEETKTLKLEVKKAPTIVSYTQDTIRALLGSHYTIFCESSGVPDSNWSWTRKVGGEDVPVQNVDGHYAMAFDGKNSSLTITPLADDDFTQYTCKADNGVNPPASKEIRMIKIERPPEPIVVCDEESAKPTSIVLKIETYSSTIDETQRPFKVHFVKMEKDENGDDKESDHKFELDFAQDGIYKLTKLEPATSYSLRITGENEAGLSDIAMVTCRTKEPTVPSKPLLQRTNPYTCPSIDCPLDWMVEDDGGKAIDEFIVEYRPIAKEGEEQQSEFKRVAVKEPNVAFKDLRSTVTYDVKVTAVNVQGTSEVAEIQIQAPDERTQVGGDSSSASSAGPSTGAIVGIVVIILLIIVVLIDVACYYVNQCGLLMCICVNLCGKTPPDVKAKETMMEEGGGGVAKDTRFEERQEKQPLKEEKITVRVEKTELVDESTPMM